MEATSKNGFEIKKSELGLYREQAVSYLRAAKYTPTGLAKQSGTEEVLTIFASISQGGNAEANVDITKRLISLSQDILPKTGVLMPEKVHNVSLVIQEGLTIALYLKMNYEKAVNYTSLQQKVQTAGKVVGEDAAKFNEMKQTATAITLFTWASYVAFSLSSKGSGSFGKFQGIPEIFRLDPIKGVSSVMYYLDKYLATKEIISSEQDLVDLVITYFQKVVDDVLQMSGTLKYETPFTEVNYKLEESDFSISGFHKVTSGATSVEFNKTEFEEIVGNKEAKHLARRIVAALLSYCFKAKKNPFDMIAKFARIIMGYGKPGTGKSLLISAIATELEERCRWLGYPFLFHPFPDNVVSTYQGGSAERTIDWFKPQADPSRIIYAPIDDAENNLMDRSRDGVSAGVKEVISVFLRMTESAYATNYGNSMIGIYTNLEHMIDKAVLSRVQKRAPIDGAITHNDFLDQDYLWMQKHVKNLGDLVKMDSIDYVFMSDQAKMTSIAEMKQHPDEIITHPVLRKVYERVIKDHKFNSPHFLAAMETAMQKECGLYTSREARNVRTNIDTIMADFDLPQELWDKEELYFLKSFEEKVNILTELLQANMKGKSFAEIKALEALKYMDTFININLSESDRKIQKMVDDMLLRDEALISYNAKKKTA